MDEKKTDQQKRAERQLEWKLGKKRDAGSQALFDQWKETGVPIREDEENHSSKIWKEATVKRVLATEVPASYYGHRGTWRDIHKDEMLKLSNVIGAIGKYIGSYVHYKTGRDPIGVSIPARCDDEGTIIKPMGPALIIGSGPTLDQAEDYIKDWRGGIFCSMGNQVSTLVKYGADPTHAVCFDSTLTIEEIQDLPLNPKKTSIITHPGMNPVTNEFYKGQKYWYKVYSPASTFHSEILRRAYDFIYATHFPFSCALSAQTAFAHAMGYDPLILVGGDFAFFETQARFTEWTCRRRYGKGTKKWGPRDWKVNKPGTPEDHSKHATLIKSDMGHMTQGVHIFYAMTTMSVHWLDGCNLYTASDGLLNGLVPRVEMKEYMHQQDTYGDQFKRTKADIREWIAPWMASKGGFYVPMFDAHKLIEVENFDVEMPMTLDMLKKEDPDMDVDAVMAECTRLLNKAPDMPYGPNKIKRKEVE